jgi:hypothetical protein
MKRTAVMNKNRSMRTKLFCVHHPTDQWDRVQGQEDRDRGKMSGKKD